MTTPHDTTPQYPFTAVVGMDDLRLALLLNAVSPAVGGVLVRGEKGTAKSHRGARAGGAAAGGGRGRRLPLLLRPRPRPTPAARTARTARAPPTAARPRGWSSCPVGASEDRLVGALDIERALTEGVKAFEPGLLADAHRGMLYVDEVNLLHDHLVDLLLDAAAMGASLRRARGRLGPARGALPAGRHDEPRRGRAAAAAAGPVRAHRRGRRLPRARRSGSRSCGAGWPTTPTRPGSRRAGPTRSDALRRRIAAARELLPDGAAGRRRAAADRRDLRRVRGGRHARRHRDGAHRDRAGRLGGADRGRSRRTSGRPRCWRCRTGGAATRSTRRAWTRTSSTRRWSERGAGRRTATTTRSRTVRTAAPEAAVRTAAAPAAGRRPGRPAAGAPDAPASGAGRPAGAARDARRPEPRAGAGDRPGSRAGRGAASRPRSAPPSRTGPARSTCRGSARARPAAGPGPAPRTAGRPAPGARRARSASCTWRRPCRPRRRTSGRAAAAGPACWCAGTTCARRCARAARATWCCSSSTPPARWRPGSG